MTRMMALMFGGMAAAAMSWQFPGASACEGTPTQREGGSPDIETASVAEVLRAEDAGFRFVSYVVVREGSRIAVEDPLSLTDYNVGDQIKYLVFRHQMQDDPNHRTLTFMVLYPCKQ